MPIFAGFISLQASALFCLGMIAGYLVAQYFSDKADSIEIPIGKYKIHLHHWLIALVGLVIVFLTNVQNVLPSFFLGLGGGSLFHGIYCYTDWYRIFKRV